ncbi:hypothetical protein O181_027667 [Austropuccinia psidii MF-1]|uniref:Trehalose-6-phosphate synthase n=1 Tax=Austropuccinia psidii MF-1 TaxID=1389203 RepID=A0A9Q3CT28_9BASI|nr:hypothetical protein [Austropuccinia psidii MF-1]
MMLCNSVFRAFLISFLWSFPHELASTEVGIRATLSQHSHLASLHGSFYTPSFADDIKEKIIKSNQVSNLKLDSTRLIVVSNRLPITMTSANDPRLTKSYSFKESSGGLVSALSGCKKQIDFRWIGWNGMDVPEPAREEVQKKLSQEFPRKAVCNGFSNSVLWPLLHEEMGKIDFHEDNWEAYKAANQKFADAVYSEMEEALIQGKKVMVWVQDYHLMLLPMMLRKLINEQVVLSNNHIRGKVHIGFFLHTPFPPVELYKQLPVAQELLRGLLQSDLVGFHVDDYYKKFFAAIQELEGVPVPQPNHALTFNGRHIHADSFPIGIDPTQFEDELKKDSSQKQIKMYEEKFGHAKVIVGVDRLEFVIFSLCLVVRYFRPCSS